MGHRRKVFAILAITGAAIGEGFLVWYYMTLAWISATPITAERLASIRKLAWLDLVGMGACLILGIAGIVSLNRRP
jgi:hypothetical protein